MTVILPNETIAFHASDGKLFFEDADPTKSIRLGKGFFNLKPIIGEPYGSIFEVRGSSLVKVNDGGGLFPAPVDTATGPADANNRAYSDTNTAQQLTDDKINDLKETGASGNEIINALVANSTTWASKTEFSKQKYLKKKQQKYMIRIQVLPSSAETLCNIYHLKRPAKILSLRYDSLGQILTFANVHAHAQMVVVDTCMGLLVGAVAERMGGFGRILAGFSGRQPADDALKRFNFDEKALQTIVPFPFSYLTQLDQSEESVCLSEQKAQPSVEARQARAKEIADRHATFSPEEQALHKIKKLAQEKRRQLKPTATMIRDWLRAPADSLILACDYDPKDTLIKLFPVLGYSKPFVIYFEYLQPLAEVFDYLKKNRLAINLQLSEAWTRGYQVLPMRSHPEMVINTSTGYILSGIKVCIA